VHYLIDAVGHLVHVMNRTDVHFLLMGTGPEHARLVEQRDRLGLTQFVDMPGRVSNEFLFRALQTMDVGVSCDPINSYNHHCTMNKVLEYMAFAKPQVLFDLREGRASAGEAAVYIKESSAQRLGEGLVQLLDDPVTCERMGRIGRQRIQTELNWSRSVEQLLAAYETALSAKTTANL
ncbi:MAG TPA: glycosyltransferase, partial [Verrucomicrobiae bacterium]|nr:glycosyltransferase [Verrucomicrobiae bacterium]